MFEVTDRDPDTASSNDMSAIMAEHKAGFPTMDVRFDTLAGCIYKMGERLDCLGVRINGAKEMISGLEDGSITMQKRIDQMYCSLKQAAIKCEDLEAQCRRYNIHIAGIVETTNMGLPDAFVEKLLLNLFDHSNFSSTFAVECAPSFPRVS
ncbi:hypothetical protein NDU88_005147 [Pleurodeles waltl]|uniref:Uncharacterized protein n=1 Tax=Pleurodeles waltl TaxID=8319 RepID=A0AAV7LLZ1_PLEWA|nr:hypothetical protein NDU88_005147 [Pleurodeles waltl]